MVWEGCSGESTHGEPYTGTKPETVDTDKGTHLQAAAATPYPIMAEAAKLAAKAADGEATKG